MLYDMKQNLLKANGHWFKSCEQHDLTVVGIFVSSIPYEFLALQGMHALYE